MKSIDAFLVEVGVISRAIDGEGSILDAVGVAAWYTVQMRVQSGLRVVRGVVESKHNVSLYAMYILDEEVGDAGAVGDEVCANAFGGDPFVKLVYKPSMSGPEVKICRRGSDVGNHYTYSYLPSGRTAVPLPGIEGC